MISTNVALNQINYGDVTPSSNAPIAPPKFHSTVPYSTVVVHETSITEQYSLVQQYLVNRPSNEDYSRLINNVHASTKYNFIIFSGFFSQFFKKMVFVRCLLI